MREPVLRAVWRTEVGWRTRFWQGDGLATVRTVERQIRQLEGFDIEVHFLGPGRERGRNVRSDRRDLPGYDYARRRADDDTVSTWRSERFERRYPGFTAAVLDAHGSEVDGRTRLATVRSSYLA